MVMEQVVIDDDEDDELEPLFSYDRVCRPVCDDSDEDVLIVGGKTLQEKGGSYNCLSLVTPACPSHKRKFEDVTKEVEDDDDWLPSPPKFANVLLGTKMNEDPTVLQLRHEREELRRLAQKIDEDRKAQNSSSELGEAPADRADERICASATNREKVLVTIQNKDGTCKNFRVFKDEKFEKLFMRYAESISIPLQQLVFLFDGEKLVGSNTPKDMDIEDEDIIEVNVRK